MTDNPTSPAPIRPVTAVDRLADEYFDAVVEASPMTATYLGVPGRDDELDDLSLEALEEQSQLRRRTLAALDGLKPVDDVDRVTMSVLRERLGLAEETYAAGYDEMDLNVLASPLQGIRDTFDLMPTATDDDWATIARRMTQVPRALDQYLDVLAHGAARGLVAPRRQVEECITQCAELTADDGYFARLVAGATAGDADLSQAVRDELESGVREAADAYAAAGERLARDLLDKAPESDAAGRERYLLMSRSFLGTTVDLDETYAWGQEELARITAEMEEVAGRIRPGATVREAIAALDVDPAYQLHGTDELKAWMQGKADGAIAALSGTHFDIPEPVRTIECLIAPTQTGGIYYTGPSDDFSRPGRMWWSVPKGVTEFGTWRELTTVYHEGVPGHHLQVAQTVFRRELLNKYRRMMVWCSGHGEGWALYAERLMAELGYMDDPGDRMGLLDGQSLRAARVVLDIGIHCGLEAPAEVGGGAWDYDKAWTFLTAHSNMDEAFLRFELNRYLGWPGQAPSYKIGERIWRQLRAEVAAREGDAFDVKAFHRRALDLGSTGLDTLREAVLGMSG
ncbi:conserved hypothetical protein [Nostocoides japonicum T1-X7]|uniref:DUF885 domain-containing protein n=1 Tax=Nostocoides japonicum T1-X7 TaxID=1194083 RepID=A0A077M557_9MICO|nr:DUF885 domain-containing protein [Tetrasphaera japonica]CCH79279.1 conserved hypothetical protein [Tetrasphaera japonica T1-X7]